jgi:hypothetical protein
MIQVLIPVSSELVSLGEVRLDSTRRSTYGLIHAHATSMEIKKKEK